MQIVKRNGKKEEVKFDKILGRVKALSTDLKMIEPAAVAQKVVAGLFDGITSTKVDELLAETAAHLNDEHPDYGLLAGRIIVSSLHKDTHASFYQTMKDLYKAGALSDDFLASVRKYSKELEKIIDFDRDFNLDFFAMKTLIGKPQGYLMRIDAKVIERPQHLFMRVAVAVADDNIGRIKELYDYLSQGYYTHATPTLFNAGHKRPQYASCFLIQIEDSIEGIFDTAKEAALISKYSGGIGIHVSNIRAAKSKIRGNNGVSNGLVPWMKIFNEVARAVNQCFTPETSIYTTAGIKHAKDVVVGDEVIGHDGKSYRVSSLLSAPFKGTMLRIELEKSFKPIDVTTEHPFYVIKDEPRGQSFRQLSSRLSSGAIGLEWCDANKLSKDDVVAFPIPKFERDIPEFSEDDCRFYGLMVTESGSMNQTGSDCSLIVRDPKYMEFAKDYLRLYDINPVEAGDGAAKLSWSIKPQFKIKPNMLYDAARKKKVQPEFIHLPESKILALMQGILEGGATNWTDLTVVSHSENVVESIRYLCLRLGVLTSGYIANTEPKLYASRMPKVDVLCDLLGIDSEEKAQDSAYNGYIFSRIDGISELAYEGEVFDYDVKTSKTYLTSNGLVHNGGKRKGSIAMYLEPWHADIIEFLSLPKEVGPEEIRARDLFLAMWMPDLFFKRVKLDADWSLFCPNECPGLQETYGEAFEELYTKYEKMGLARTTMKAQDLLAKICECQIEHGMPYILAKDSVNNKSNQKNIGTIKSSNLCLSGDTLVLTKDGHQPIEDLVGRTVEIFDGNRWLEISNFKKTKERANLLEVTLRDGSTLRTTPYHKFVLEDGSLVEAKDLTLGARLKWHEEQVDGLVSIKGAYLKGFAVGDGTSHKDKAIIKIYEPKYGCADRLIASANELVPDSLVRETDARIFLGDERDGAKVLNGIAVRRGQLIQWVTNFKRHLPHEILSWDMKSKADFIAGVMDAYGSIVASKEITSYQISSVERPWLLDFQQLLKTIGVYCTLGRMHEASMRDFGDGYGAYQSQESWRLTISNVSARRLSSLVTFSRLKYFPQKDGYKTKPAFAEVKAIRELEEPADVYCCNVPTTHQFALSCGLMTGNCAEIMEYSSIDETAVCNLASMCLSKFVKNGLFDFKKFEKAVRAATRNLNNVIDRTFYPTDKTKKSNMRHRPIGIGVQGLADVFFQLGIAFDSPEALELDRQIFETMYFGFLTESMELAKKNGPYETFAGSPASQGILQFDMWNVKPSDRYDWDGLKQEIMKHGLRNSLGIALMPTASTASVFGNTEAFEPQKGNIYRREVLAGEFMLINKYLVHALQKLGLWNSELKNQIVMNNGSVQDIAAIPKNIQNIYKTAYELSQKVIIEHAATRGPFVCQSQSMNLFFEDATMGKLSGSMIWGWERGLKTISYYIRSKPASRAAKIGMTSGSPAKEYTSSEAIACSIDNKDDCEACGS
jgi:ribonucleoside-diphosphate reductase alpha chain